MSLPSFIDGAVSPIKFAVSPIKFPGDPEDERLDRRLDGAPQPQEYFNFCETDTFNFCEAEM